MTQAYRGFLLYSGASPQSDTLLGRVMRWAPTGSIDHQRGDRSVIELTRFELRSLTFDDEAVAERFGLEIARLLRDSCFRDFAIARYETEKRLIRQSQLTVTRK